MEQVQGNITKPYSEIRLSDNNRQEVLDKLIADATKAVNDYQAWLFPENCWNPAYNYIAGASEKNPDFFSLLITEQNDRSSVVYQRLKQAEQGARTPEEKMYVDSKIESLRGQMESLFMCRHAAVDVSMVQHYLQGYLANLKSAKQADQIYSSSNNLWSSIARVEKLIANPKLDDPILKKVIEGELAKIKEEIRNGALSSK